MKDIKFRAYDKVSKVMKYFQYEIFNRVPDGFEDLSELMQYTGLKDKKETEIYEGDVLYRSGYWSFYIGFENGCFVGLPCNEVQRINWEHYPLNKDRFSDWEVVGNIYENPELLEK